ncbi:MAG: SdrD B-like domain-containing protein [Ramlibacter sp.]
MIGNAGPSTLTTASIVDSLPANLTAYAVQSAVQGGASVPTAFSLNGTSVSGSVTIPLNGTVSVTINVSATAAGGYTNTVTLTPLSNVTNLGSTTATAPGTVTSAADVSVTLVIPASGTAGQTVSGTITFYNTGITQADNVTRTLVLGGGTLTAVSGTGTIVAGSITATFHVASMAAGNTATYTFTYVLPSSGTVTMTATITTTTAESTKTNNVSTATTVVGSLADVSVTLSLPVSASANAVVVGTVTYYNVGVSTAADVTRTVALKGGTLTAVSGTGTIVAGSVTATFNVGTMPGGSSASFTFSYVVPATGSVSATASIATSTTETVTTNNVATAVTLVGTQPPDLSVSLAVSPSLLAAGSNTVMVTVNHISGMNTTGTVVLTMPNASTVGFTIATPLSVGQSVTFSANYSVSLLTSTTQTFSAIVTPSAAADSNPPNNTTTLSAGIGASLNGLAWIDANRNRTFQAGEAILPNLLVRLYNSSSVVVGTAMTGSDGRYSIRGVPAGAGYRVEFFNCVTPSDASTCAAISTTPYNQAATTQGGNASTGVTTVTSTTSGATVGQAITSVTLYAGDNTVDQNLPLDPRGQVYDSVTRQPIANVLVRLNGPDGFFVPATHLIDLNGAGQVNNESTTDANGLYQFIFINNPPPGVYTLSIVSVPSGYLATPATLGGVAQPNVIANVLTSTWVVPSAATNMQPGYAAPGTPPAGVVGSAAVGVSGTQHVMTMSFAFGVGYIGELFNNNIPLDAIASGGGGGGTTGTFDLSITKNGPATVASGVTATYTLQITNPGPTAAANATVTDVMPAGLSLLSATVQPANAMALSVTPAGLVATTTSLAVGVTNITLVVQVTGAAGGVITNVASVATTSTETNVTNNTASFTTRVEGTDLSLTKRGPTTLAAGGTASYVLTISNSGPTTASNVTLTDVMPAGLTLVSASVVSGSFTLITTEAALTAVAPTMAAGSAVIALTVAVGDAVVGTVTNVANVTSTTSDLQPNNNTGTATSGVLGADLAITKLGPPTISAAGTSTYTLVIANYGPSSAGNVTVTDVMPLGLTLIGASASSNSVTMVADPEKFVATATAIRVGSTVTVTLTVQAAYTATGTVTNIANVTSTTPDPTVTNNIGSVSSAIKEVEPGVILVNKTGNKTVAEVGDSVQYTIRMRNTINLPVNRITLEDLLPAGFRYIPGTARLNGKELADPAGGIGRQLGFDIGTIPGNTVYELTYFVRLGVGSQQGDGINRATAVFPGARGTPIRSNTALFKVNVQGGVFSNEGCIVGKVYMDCDGNSAQGSDGGSRELGIPGVRLVMLDGSFIVTDNEGKYSLCGVKPQTHVIKVDRTTLPRGARLLPSSNRNAGVGDSLFVEMKGGELARADFIEGSCSPEVLEQVKARRAQGGVNLPEPDRQLLPVTPGAPLSGVRQ